MPLPNKKLTIYDIKRIIKENDLNCYESNFAPMTLDYYGRTLKDFAVIKESDTTYLVFAPIYNSGQRKGFTQQLFSTETNTLKTIYFQQI